MEEKKENRVQRAVDIVLERWDELAVIDHGGELLLPASIKRRQADGSLTETPIMLRNLSNPQRVAARRQARLLEAAMGLDPVRDQDLCDDLDSYCQLSFAVRDPAPPYDQHMATAEELWKAYSQQSMAELWGVFDRWRDTLDPRFGELSAEEIWRVIAAVKARRRIDPLAAMPSVAQLSCIIFMAEEACSSPNAPSWLRSSGSLTPAPSAPTKPESSSA